MIETLTQNVELIQSALTVLSVPAFIVMVTGLLKDELSTYTPYIALGLGMLIGTIVIIMADGISVMGILAGLITGGLLGGTAVGLKVIADGKPDEVVTEDWE